MQQVIVITGPCGAGKTTVAEIVAKKLGAALLKADDVTEELFPGLKTIYKHPEKMQELKDEVIRRAKDLHDAGTTVVIDFVVLGEYINVFKETFGDDLVFRALLPRMEMAIERDAARASWTVGKKHIEELYGFFHRDEPLIGKENIIDNSDETAEETAARILAAV